MFFKCPYGRRWVISPVILFLHVTKKISPGPMEVSKTMWLIAVEYEPEDCTLKKVNNKQCKILFKVTLVRILLEQIVSAQSHCWRKAEIRISHWLKKYPVVIYGYYFLCIQSIPTYSHIPKACV